eukprot:TRINITY_DN10052_c0_g1_i1.p1 TRINITY_DN10052_c0_g1~~TRINITY_DN10052_c0_g1_i1.p1  ORF type:complete len:171 (-),score=30.60 TRINITY_DN10052_c0_g1_i1:70-582(-)
MLLSTDRLVMRRAQSDESLDVSFIFQLVNSPKWIEYIGDRNVRTMEDAKVYLERHMIPRYADGDGYGSYIVETHDGTRVGICGILKRDYLEYPDIGFALLGAYEGQGFAYEASIAVMKFARHNMGLTHLCAIISPENIRSVGLIERLGYEQKENIEIGGKDTMYFLKELN